DAEADRLAQIMAEELIQLLDIFGNLRGCLERLAAGSLTVARKTEQREQSIAEKLVRLTTARHHGLRHRAEKPVDDKHGVERQAIFRQPRRAAHVHEHADEVAFLADMRG